jgi:hypothetical protein
MNDVEETGLTDRQRYWLEHVQACEASAKYAAEHDVKVHTMYAGKKKLVEKGILPRTLLNKLLQFMGVIP